jgi:hypothetical protein
MPNFLANLPHLLMATLVIAASVVLALTGHITGGESLGTILAAGGFSLGAAAGSQSPSTAVSPIVADSGSDGGQTPPATGQTSTIQTIPTV